MIDCLRQRVPLKKTVDLLLLRPIERKPRPQHVELVVGESRGVDFSTNERRKVRRDFFNDFVGANGLLDASVGDADADGLTVMTSFSAGRFAFASSLNDNGSVSEESTS